MTGMAFSLTFSRTRRTNRNCALYLPNHQCLSRQRLWPRREVPALPPFFMDANICYFSNGFAKAVLSEGLVPVTDEGDQVLSQMVTLRFKNQPEVLLWIDEIYSVCKVLADAMERAVERREQYDREETVERALPEWLTKPQSSPTGV